MYIVGYTREGAKELYNNISRVGYTGEFPLNGEGYTEKITTPRFM